MGGFLVVHIPAIVEYCPNLESLTLDNCKTNQSTEPKEKMPRLQKLQKLVVKNLSIITSESLLTLLSSPSLSHIEIFMEYCNTLTDNVIQMAAKIHSFRNLEYLLLFHCNLVTKKGINNFFKRFESFTGNQGVSLEFSF